MRFLSLLFLLLLSQVVIGQAGLQIADIIDPNRSNRNLSIPGFNLKQIEGSPFLFDDWEIGNIVDVQSNVYTSIPIKYRAYDENIIIKNEDKETMLDNENIKSFFITHGDQKYFFEKVNIQGKNYFLRVLMKSDKVNFYEHLTKEFQRSNNSDNGYGTAQTTKKDKFVPSTKFYVQTSKGIQKIKRSNKHLQVMFPKYAKEIKSFLKKQKLNIRNNKDLEKIAKNLDKILK